MTYTELLGRIEVKVDGKDPGRADANSVKAAHAGGQRN
jgi:hypothetical protein